MKKIAVKPISSMGEFTSDEEYDSPDEETDEEEEEIMREAFKKVKIEARKDREEREADIETITSSKSKRGRKSSLKSTHSAKRSKC